MNDFHRYLKLFLLLCAAIACTANGKTLDASQVTSGFVSLTPYFATLEDADQTLTLEDVQKPEIAQRFKQDYPADEAIGFGFTRSAYWLRIVLSNGSDQPVQRMMEISYSRLSDVQFFQPSDGDAYRAIHTGAIRDFATRPYKNRFFVFPLALAPHSTQTIYLRLESNAALVIPGKLWTPEAFHEHERSDYLSQAWYFGLATGMAIFNLLIFVVLRDKIYPMYVTFVVFSALTLAAINGLTKEFLWPNAGIWSDIATTAGFAFGFASFIPFMRRMLNTAQLTPRLDRLLFNLTWLFLLIPLACFVSYRPVAKAATLLYGLTALLFVVTGIYLCFKRQRSAYFFTSAFGMLCLGGIMSVLRSLGVLPTNILTVSGMQIGSSLEMLILAFALADRFNEYRREKEKAQMEALIAQEHLVENLKQTEHVLEERVTKRTTELQASNESLKSTQKRLREITDNVPVGIFQIKAYPNGELRIKFLSKRILELFGISTDSPFDRQQAMELLVDEEELPISRQQALFELVPDEDQDVVEREMTKAVLSRSDWQIAYRVILRSGETRWMQSVAYALPMPDGTVHFNGYIEDMTARKELVEEIQEAREKAEQMLHELRTTQTQLIQSEKMASLGQLVANVAHEINTPIGAVKSSGENIADALELTLESLPRLFDILSPESRSRFMQLLQQSRQRQEMLSTREERNLIRDLTAQLQSASVADPRHAAEILVQLRAQSAYAEYLPLLTHPDSRFILETARSISSIIGNTANINTAVDRVAKIIFALKSFSRIDATEESIDADLAEGIETVLTIYQNQIKQGTELIREFESIPPLRCRPDELNQVWTNLVHNALQAMKNQGTLTVAIRRNGNEAVVSVADTGCGIPEEIRSKIFDPFFTTKPAGEGSGLGLDIVRKIIDKHQGRIEVQSQVGVGTCFLVYLPYPAEGK